LLCANIAVIVPLFIPASASAEEDAPRFKVLSLNVERDGGDPKAVEALILRESPDIVALMEVDEAWLDKLDVALWMMPFQRAVPRNDNFGIAIFSKAPIRKVHDMSDAGEVPSIAVDIDVWGHPTTLVVTHPLPPM